MGKRSTRLGDLFLAERGHLLGDHGFEPDPGWVERTADGYAIYHYSRAERLPFIFGTGGGLRARKKVLTTDLTPEFHGCFEVHGFLEPDPQWLSAGPYFGDLGREMRDGYMGEVLLRASLPNSFGDVYVCDFAHNLECKHAQRRGRPVLELGYDCRTGHECVRACTHSYVPIAEYAGGHVAPLVAVVRRSRGIVIPRQLLATIDADD
jgi:hypothetical protein